jgi:alanine racemase
MLASRQPIVASVRRDAWVEVDLNAIEHNYALARSHVPASTKVMAVVKSDAYGHGAVAVSEVLQAMGADALAVASVDEGCQLRQSGLKLPILLLSPCPSWAVATALENNLQLTICRQDQIEETAQAAQRLKTRAQLHIKVDTGMHRLGLAPQHVLDAFAAVSEHKSLEIKGFFSHLAQADDQALTQKQNAVFKQLIDQIKQRGFNPGLIHLASSDATRMFPDTHYDMVRPGLMLYGLEARAIPQAVRPAMSVRGRIFHCSQIEAGEAIGYNLTWQANRPSRIASIPIGYADGVDRGLSNRLTALLHGQEIRQVGLISMDQMMFDITDVPQAQEGDVITLLGEDSQPAATGGTVQKSRLYMATWANLLDSITYELACRLKARMPRIYTRQTVRSEEQPNR